MKRALVFASMIAMLAAPALATKASAASPAKSCFPVREIDGWRAADARTIYLRVAQTRYYRLDLGNPCSVLTDKGAHLITQTTGSDLVCTAADWDLGAARDMHGSLPMRCIVKTMTPLSAAEADAIPKEFKPH
ncbi:MAG: hypothetical protein JOZ72_13640 [Alphaproteobacteria bacterium]|nr:hypothetical protein [Alphaproteobacteria bacterium]